MSVDPAYTLRLSELAARSQLFWALAVASVLVLALVVCALGRRCGRSGSEGTSTESATARRLPWWRRLHEAESATASLEFLLVLFPFLMIVLTIWQLAFMFNAQLHVGYSAYAAARSAAVVIPQDLPNERAGRMLAETAQGAEKWQRIQRAAIPGVMAISPGNERSALGVAATSRAKALLQGEEMTSVKIADAAAALLPRLLLMTAHYGRLVLRESTLTDGEVDARTSRTRRAIVKSVFADNHTRVLIEGRDARATMPDLSTADTVTVEVQTVLWLHVPFVGRLIEALFAGLVNPLTGQPPDTRNPFPSLQLSETITMMSWRQKCAMSKYCP